MDNRRGAANELSGFDVNSEALNAAWHVAPRVLNAIPNQTGSELSVTHSGEWGVVEVIRERVRTRFAPARQSVVSNVRPRTRPLIAIAKAELNEQVARGHQLYT